MDSSKGVCASCGAPAGGLICEHCGNPTAHLAGVSEENRALDEYHNLLRQLKPEDQRRWLLTSGFIPDDKKVLIEAGVHCLPLLRNPSVCDATASRLEAIIVKLNLLHGDEQAGLAVKDFRSGLENYQAVRRRDNILIVGCLSAIVAVIIVVGWWLARGFV